MRFLALVLCLALASVPARAESPVRSLADMNLTSLDGKLFDKSTLDGHVVLFVNVASRCGLTPQYEGLQKLYDAKKDAGLVIVGVPCNQFAGQEPGDAEQIAAFCERNYGVTFPILEKQKVNGPGRSELYSWLVGSEAGGGGDIEWNFAKFVVGRDGQVADRFAPPVTPKDTEFVAAIDAALGR